MPYTTIDQVLAQLENIIAESKKTGDRVGYFAALYYKVTAKVKEGIAKNEFENGPRMERLDVLFASRYLDALQQWRKSQPVTESWKVAFEATRRSSLLVLQQLLLGVNAHINLDLGIAAVETVGQGTIQDIQKDFDAINTIITSLTYEVIHEITQVSPLLSLLGLHANNTNSLLIQFSIGNARDGAWCFAEELSQKRAQEYSDCISARDKDIAQLARALTKSTGFIRFTLWLVHVVEWHDPRKIIRVLHKYKKKFIKAAMLLHT
jgi:hypothetical protein